MQQIDNKRRQYAIYGLVILGLSLNAWLFALRRQRDFPMSELRSRQQTKEAHRASWAAETPVALRSNDMEIVVQQLPSTDCLQPPANVAAIGYSEMSEQQQADLDEAVRGLLAAFTDYSPESLVDYMKGRGERLDAKMVAVMKRILVDEHDVDAKRLDAMDDFELLSMFWRIANLKTHWESVLPDSSCLVTWRVSDHSPLDGALQDTLAKADRNVWNGYARHNHVFVSDRSVEEALRTEGTALCADTRVLIKHDVAHQGQVTPYHFRFWYDPQDERWHPIDMVRLAAFKNAPFKILF